MCHAKIIKIELLNIILVLTSVGGILGFTNMFQYGPQGSCLSNYSFDPAYLIAYHNVDSMIECGTICNVDDQCK